MRKSMKHLISMGLCCAMLLGLCGCGNNDEWVFLLNGERLYSKDVAAFAYIYTTEYNIKSAEQLEEIYEDTMTYGEFYKQQLEEDIVSTVLLHKEADANRVKLSHEAEEQIQLATNDVVNRFGEATLKEAGISEADIENVYEMKMMGEVYLDGLSDDKEEASDELERYIKVYQVTFPTVEIDADGMVMSDTEGNLKRISSTEISQMEQDAAVFAETAKQGKNMEKLLADYGSTVTGIEKYMKYSDLEQEYKSAIDGMSVGDVSDVIESDYGFCVVRLLEKDDADYAEVVASHEAETEQVSGEEDELERLYSEYAQPNREYKNTAVWDAIKLSDYIK